MLENLRFSYLNRLHSTYIVSAERSVTCCAKHEVAKGHFQFTTTKRLQQPLGLATRQGFQNNELLSSPGVDCKGVKHRVSTQKWRDLALVSHPWETGPFDPTRCRHKAGGLLEALRKPGKSPYPPTRHFTRLARLLSSY